MIKVTDAAAARLHELAGTAPEGRMLRLASEGERLNLLWDEKKPEDKAVSHEDATVLIFDGQISDLLDGRTLDVKQTEAGPALMLT